MDLILWRHAEAEDGHPDAARRLTHRGREQAERSAKWLAARLPAHARVLVSPAVRAQQTAQALSGWKLETEPRVGLQARASDLLQAAGWDDDPDDRKSGAVLIVGHQPTLGQLASLLLSGNESDWPIKKGALWWFTRHEGGAALRAVIEPKLV